MYLNLNGLIGICLHAAYLPKEYGISVALTFDDKILIEKSMSGCFDTRTHSVANSTPARIVVRRRREVLTDVRKQKVCIIYIFVNCCIISLYTQKVITFQISFSCKKSTEHSFTITITNIT
ncbi:UNVERIFIED_CONTAM: hypothetical protein NCL1_41324 [Trichonephila clavipes]